MFIDMFINIYSFVKKKLGTNIFLSTSKKYFCKQICCYLPDAFFKITFPAHMRRYRHKCIVYKYAKGNINFSLHKITVVYIYYQRITRHICHNVFLYTAYHSDILWFWFWIRLIRKPLYSTLVFISAIRDLLNKNK